MDRQIGPYFKIDMQVSMDRQMGPYFKIEIQGSMDRQIGPYLEIWIQSSMNRKMSISNFYSEIWPYNISDYQFSSRTFQPFLVWKIINLELKTKNVFAFFCICILGRPPQDVLAVLDFRVPYFRPESLRLRLLLFISDGCSTSTNTMAEN